MPYITDDERFKYDFAIDSLVDKLEKQPVGHINYVISRMFWRLFKKNRSYTFGNNLMGVLECVKAEFYRRKLAPYEDEKMIENGDVKE